jgi:hypothetical protein
MQQKVKKGQNKPGLKQKKDMTFPLERENFIIIGIGVILIVIGYLLMAQNSVNGFVPTVISPILLVLGYCVAIPYGILKKPKPAKSAETSSQLAESTGVVSETSSSNIKTS